MPDTTPRLYEGLFLLNQSAVANGLPGCIDLVRDLLKRSDADIIVLRKWDDRRLAYPIAGQKRGTYLIAYFRITPTSIAGIERDVNLSEDVLRVLMTRCDHYGEVELKELEELAQRPVIEDDEDADGTDNAGVAGDDAAPVGEAEPAAADA